MEWNSKLPSGVGRNEKYFQALSDEGVDRLFKELASMDMSPSAYKLLATWLSGCCRTLCGYSEPTIDLLASLDLKRVGEKHRRLIKHSVRILSGSILQCTVETMFAHQFVEKDLSCVAV